ncbi:MAG: DNA alkylation repair protein [Alphaproteobacteria bacterium]|nr:DNA alkylation repair protein [Alphaproteobacteria bacterium]
MVNGTAQKISVKQPEEAAPKLKDSIFSHARIHHIAAETAKVSQSFDHDRFLAETLAGLDDLTLMERLRHVANALHAALPMDFPSAVAVLRAVAPRLDSKFVTLTLSEFVALYGQDEFDLSMDALRFFTPFGSSEFAVRHFLRRDLQRTLAVMERWAHDDSPDVRRLASEGSRPRLPWSFRIEPLVRDPSPAAPILEALRADPSPYVRKSVANHLNDITKDNPEWALDRIKGWPREDARVQWIARHALRSLVKAGNKDALSLVGASEGVNIRIDDLAISPKEIRAGETLTVSFRITSESEERQTIVLDYAIHYVRKNGRTSRKVFKLKTLILESGHSATLSHRQRIENLSVRTLYSGQHNVELLGNGQILGRGSFELQV